MANDSFISIIIVNYNGKRHLENCLKSLMAIDYKKFEVILVDNNSTDDSIEFVKSNYPSVTLLKLDKNYGFAEPNNKGTKIAKGNYFLFLNNDTIVDPNFISEMVKVLENDSKIGICQSLLLKPDGTIDSSGDFIDEIGVVYNSKKQVEQVREISSARGAAMMVKRSVFEKIGGFDEKFFVSFEDVDFCWRAWIMGYRIVLVPKSVVYHGVGQTIQKLKSDIEFHGLKNQISIKITNFESYLVVKNLFLFLTKYGFKEFRIWIDYKLKGHTSIKATDYEETIAEKHSLNNVLKSIGWIIRNSGYLYKKHKMVNSSRLLSTKALQEMNILNNIKK